jgi:hypothetical protein
MGDPMDGAFQLGCPGVRFDQITDGLTHTILAGEKHVPLGRFGVGWLDSSTYNGDYPTPSARTDGKGKGLAQSRYEVTWKFGSYHITVVQFLFGDGSVRPLDRSLDPIVLGQLLNINDGLPLAIY